MPQICSIVSDPLYNEIVALAEAEGITKGKAGSMLIERGLRGEKGELQLLKQEVAGNRELIASNKELIELLRTELGFLRTQFTVLQNDIARPLKLLTEGALHQSKQVNE